VENQPAIGDQGLRAGIQLRAGTRLLSAPEKSLAISNIEGFAIPRLIDFDDDLLVVEMDVVSPPFLLDFAKAYLDGPPDFSPEVMADWEEQQMEWFGDRWPQVRSVLYSLERLAIYYRDVRPGNIMFPDDT